MQEGTRGLWYEQASNKDSIELAGMQVVLIINITDSGTILVTN